MSKFKSSLLGTFLVLFIPLNSWALNGNVATENGLAVQKADVLLSIQGQTYKDLTGSDGKFSFPDLPANVEYNITVKKSGFGSISQTSNTSSNTVLKIILNPHKFQLKLKVLARNAEPLANTIISAGSLGVFNTDATGEYILNLDYGTQYKLSAQLEDYYFINKPKGILNGNTTRVIVGELN